MKNMKKIALGALVTASSLIWISSSFADYSTGSINKTFTYTWTYFTGTLFVNNTWSTISTGSLLNSGSIVGSGSVIKGYYLGKDKATIALYNSTNKKINALKSQVLTLIVNVDKLILKNNNDTKLTADQKVSINARLYLIMSKLKNINSFLYSLDTLSN